MITIQPKKWVFMIKNKISLLILLLFGDLFASCFYDDVDKIVHLKDTIVDCYKLIISYNPPIQKCGGLNYGIGLEKKKNCNSFEKNDVVLAIYDSVKEYTSDYDKIELFYLNDTVRVKRILSGENVENQFFVYDTTINDTLFDFYFKTLYTNGRLRKKWGEIDTTLTKAK